MSEINSNQPSDYQYDIFVSYRRSDPEWIRWTRDNFIRAVSSLLRPALGHLKVAFDEELETGVSWPISLAQKLAASKIMIPILSRDYFESDWCKLEIALMRHREKACGFRTYDNPHGLIVPVIIDDGNCFPPEIQAIQGQKIHDYANPFMRPDSPLQESFAEELKKKLCRDVESAMHSIPDFDPSWNATSAENFCQRFNIQVEGITTLPKIEVAPSRRKED